MTAAEVDGTAIVLSRWSAGGGWQDPEPMADDRLTFGAHTSFLHYGQAVFEGLRAFRRLDGSVALFRPRDHHRRLLASAQRMDLPSVPWTVFESAVVRYCTLHAETLVRPGDSLYLRPVLLAVTETLGIKGRVTDCLLMITGLRNFRHVGGDGRGLRLHAERDLQRTWPGGTGTAKSAGNYGAARLGQVRAAEAGCDDALWVSPDGRIGESSSMNVFAVLRKEGADRLVTPWLDGRILAGITRDSVIALAGRAGITPVEEDLDVDDLVAAIDGGTVTEFFATGTASGIVPVEGISLGGRLHRTGGGTSLARSFSTSLEDIQTGRAPDRDGWLHLVPDDAPGLTREARDRVTTSTQGIGL